MAYESVPYQNVGLATSSTQASFDIGEALAAVWISSIVNNGSSSHNSAPSSPTAWRMIFFMAFPFALLSILVCAAVWEPQPSRAFRREHQTYAIPVARFIRSPVILICSALVLLADGAMRAIVVLRWAGYTINHSSVPFDALLASVPMAWVTMVATIMVSGALSDVVGRPKLLCAYLLATGLLVFPLLSLFQYAYYPSRMWPLTAFHFLFFGVLCGLQQGCFPALLGDIFPAPIRCTGICVTYSISRFLGILVLVLVLTIYTDQRGGEAEQITSSHMDLSSYSSLNTGICLVAACLVSAVSSLLVPVSSSSSSSSSDSNEW